MADQLTCSRRHTGHDDRAWRLGNDDLVAVVTASGVRQIKAHCPDCGHVSEAIPFNVLPEPPDFYPVMRDNRFLHGSQQCAVKDCGSDRTEYHHFAPRAVFGPYGADDWPGSYLCREHHEEWHGRMDGYQWRRAVTYRAAS